MRARRNKSVPSCIEFFCPGCKEEHAVFVARVRAAGNPVWGWNQRLDLPTFTPSILITTGHFCTGHQPGDSCWCTYKAEHPEKENPPHCNRCHSYVTDGRIQFLSDSSHKLAGQTVDLPEVED